jgi:RNA polymerase sigma-70 factor (ECF subfamily)
MRLLLHSTHAGARHSKGGIMEELVKLYGVQLYRFCNSLAFSREDADDLFQETFKKTFEQMHKLLASPNPLGFLFSTCAFIWKSHKRKYSRRNRIAPTGVLNEFVADTASMEDDLVKREEIQRVRTLVNQLKDKYRIPTVLFYTNGLSVTEIAAVLKIPAGTVKSRLFKARKLIEEGMVLYGGQ